VDRIAGILANVDKVIIGKREAVSRLLTGLLCGGHLLIEDVPGVGKTTLVKALAITLGCTFKRIQFTPDLMPADIVGITVFDKGKGEFLFKPGPIMSQVVLADEINRTSPKTQSSLLEAMAEGQVTVDGITHPLPQPFVVMATQNPIEYEGTFPLPEAQLDRFMMRITLGYPEQEDENRIVKLPMGDDPLAGLSPVISPPELMAMQQQAAGTYIAKSLENYIVTVTRNTRSHPAILLGVSPRGGQYLYRAAKGEAFLQGRDYVLPDDVKAVIGPVFAHRLILTPEARLKGKDAADVLKEILLTTPVPVIPHGQNS
jgi:MoxR-like ATPase